MGGSASQLSAEDLEKLRKDSPFDNNDIKRILSLYAEYDKSERGSSGIELDAILTMPELGLHPLLPRLLQMVKDNNTNKVHPQGFVKLLGILSSKTPIETKKQAAFRCFDLNGVGRLRHEELFQVYKLLFDFALDDDQLVRIVSNALDHPSLQTSGEITYLDFVKVVANSDIQSRFTLDL